MTSTPLKPDIQGLQKDVVDLLERVSQLMGRASTQLGSKDGFEAKYATYRDQIAEEARKVKNLELRMAIAAPMKAGKSTIINAIIGQEILPSRNAAMTTLPTEIVLKRDLKEPVLILSSETLSIFREAWLTLQREIKKLGTEELQKKMGEYPHLLELVAEVRDTICFPIRAETVGCQEVNKTLSGLNDIIRLCSQLARYADPLQFLNHVPRIETPLWQLQVDAPIETLGNLVIVDTPGPNEAGENLRLVGVVEEQLQKSSLVLIVLDYTQLKTKAAEEVKEDVHKVIRIRGKENLYILINKVDQRAANDMSPEQVQQFVAAEFGLDASAIQDRVFEIAARRALYATSFQLELQQNSSLAEISQMKTSQALAQQAFGDMWESFFKIATAEQMQSAFQQVWGKSGFSPFLNQSINALMTEAAPRCMKVALVVARAYLEELQDAVKLRRSAISKDAATLKAAVYRIQDDLRLLGECRFDVRKEVEAKKNDLAEELKVILQRLKNTSAKSMEEYFFKGLAQRLNILERLDLEGRKLFVRPIRIPIIDDLIDAIIPYSLSNLLKYQVVLAGRNSIKFRTKQEAEDFISQVFLEVRQIIEKLLSNKFTEIQDATREFQIELKDLLEQETRGIIEQARNRLNEEFNVNLSLPKLLLEKEMEISPTEINISILKREKGFFEAIVNWFQSWFGHQEPDEEFYIVSLEDMVARINYSMEQKIKETEFKIYDYLDRDFQKTTNNFFSGLDDYLQNYQDSLKQGLDDQKSSIENQKQLKHLLDYFVEDSNKYLEELKRKLGYVDKLMPSTKRIALSK